MDQHLQLPLQTSNHKYNFFQDIKRLRKGDIIEYQTEQGIRTYEVYGKEQIEETNLSILENTKENKLTLITCIENMPEYRLCIQAYEIK